MRRGMATLTIVLLLLGLLAWGRPTVSQEPLPTPRGQLGGREPLVLTPAIPSPAPTVPATATPAVPASPVGVATPVEAATPIGSGTPVYGADGERAAG